MGSACISMEPWSGRLTSHSGSHTVQSSSGSHPTLDPIPCSLRAAHIPLWIPYRAVFERLTSHSGSHPVQSSSGSHPTLDPIPCSLRAAHIPLWIPSRAAFELLTSHSGSHTVQPSSGSHPTFGSHPVQLSSGSSQSNSRRSWCRSSHPRSAACAPACLLVPTPPLMRWRRDCGPRSRWRRTHCC
jgi:hypothetical protein